MATRCTQHKLARAYKIEECCTLKWRGEKNRQKTLGVSQSLKFPGQRFFRISLKCNFWCKKWRWREVSETNWCQNHRPVVASHQNISDISYHPPATSLPATADRRTGSSQKLKLAHMALAPWPAMGHWCGQWCGQWWCAGLEQSLLRLECQL